MAYYNSGEPLSVSDLEHQGVMGMKWGVRKVKKYDSDVSRKLRDKTNTETENKRAYKDFRKSRKNDKRVANREKQVDHANAYHEDQEREIRKTLGNEPSSHSATMALVNGYVSVHKSNETVTQQLKFELDKAMNKQLKFQQKAVARNGLS